MSLYRTSQKLHQFLELFEDLEGEVDESVIKEFLKTQEEFNQEIQGILENRKEILFQIEYAKSEIERIADFKKIEENKITRIDKLVLGLIKTFGEKDPKKDIWRGTYGTFKVNTRQSVEIDYNEELIENKYKSASLPNIQLTDSIYPEVLKLLNLTTDRLPVSISKTLIKIDMKEGDIKGVTSIPKYTIQIK